MNDTRSRRVLLAAGIWIAIVAVAAGVYKFSVAPKIQQEEAEKRREAIAGTGSDSRFQETLRIAHDSFSGYSALRSGALAERMAVRGVKLDFVDDGANYGDRIRAVQRGDVELAVFTIDALLAASAELDDWPATILLILDETRGADAMVAYEADVPDLDALNDPSASVVYTEASPSETFARILHDHFSIDTEREQWLSAAADPSTVLAKLRRGRSAGKRGYVLWEPHVSQALEIDGVHVVVDTSDLRGYIVDVLVANRDWLAGDGHVLSKALVQDYLATTYDLNASGGWKDLVQRDAKESGSPITGAQAQRLVAGLSWKNTLENYGHFGLLDGHQGKGVFHLEGVIRRIASLLVRSGALSEPPLEGRESWLFYDGILKELQAEGFHPALGRHADRLDQDAPIRGDAELRTLTDADWSALVPVGALRVPPIRFARGGARLNGSAKRALNALAERIEAWPLYYLTIVGQTRQQGDSEANRKLSVARSAAVFEALLELGVPRASMRTQARSGSSNGGAAQSVVFEVGQPSY